MVCHTDADVLAKALKAVRQAEGHFIWAQLRDLCDFFDQRREMFYDFSKTMQTAVHSQAHEISKCLCSRALIWLPLRCGGQCQIQRMTVFSVDCHSEAPKNLTPVKYMGIYVCMSSGREHPTIGTFSGPDAPYSQVLTALTRRRINRYAN